MDLNWFLNNAHQKSMTKNTLEVNFSITVVLGCGIGLYFSERTSQAADPDQIPKNNNNKVDLLLILILPCYWATHFFIAQIVATKKTTTHSHPWQAPGEGECYLHPAWKCYFVMDTFGPAF